MDINQEKLITLDSSLKEQGLFWRSKSKEQGFNVAVVEGSLSEIQRLTISELVNYLDGMNTSLLSMYGIGDYSLKVPSIRLNRLDIGIAESGGVFLIEQNPGWVDLLGFSAVLSEDTSVLWSLTSMLMRDYGIGSLDLLYSEYSQFAKYEMEMTAGIIQANTGLSSGVKAIEDVKYPERNGAYYLNSPYEALNEQEGAVMENLTSDSIVFPGREMSFLDDKSLLLEMNRFRPEAKRFPDTFGEFVGMVRSGLNMLKPIRTFSTKGVSAKIDDLCEDDLLRLYEDVRVSEREYILEREIPLRTMSGVGFDYVGKSKTRPQVAADSKGKKVFMPIEVKIDEWPAKYCVWTLNDAVGPILGVASREADQIVINDAGFFFKC